MTIFSQHNLLQDPPFIRMDLISCRNLLIYLNSKSQHRILKNFHYGLISNGLMFLGRSESIGSLTDAFADFNKKHKLYIRRNSKSFRPELSSQFRILHSSDESPPIANNEFEYRQLGEKKIVEVYAKPTILATHQGKILEFYNDCSHFIQVKPGSADFNLFSILDPLLKTELKILLHRALHSKETIFSQPVPVFIENSEQSYRLGFNLIDSPQTQEQLILISFDKILARDINEDNTSEGSSESLTDLKHELSIRRESLHSVTEALETSIYELQSLNEEAQVSNEELETSNEELQSINEELANKTDELEQMNDDFENVLNSIEKSILVISKDLGAPFLLHETLGCPIANLHSARSDLWEPQFVLRPTQLRKKHCFVKSTSNDLTAVGITTCLPSELTSSLRIVEFPCRLLRTKNHHFAALRFPDFQRKRQSY